MNWDTVITPISAVCFQNWKTGLHQNSGISNNKYSTTNSPINSPKPLSVFSDFATSFAIKITYAKPTKMDQ